MFFQTDSGDSVLTLLWAGSISKPPRTPENHTAGNLAYVETRAQLWHTVMGMGKPQIEITPILSQRLCPGIGCIGPRCPLRRRAWEHLAPASAFYGCSPKTGLVPSENAQKGGAKAPGACFNGPFSDPCLKVHWAKFGALNTKHPAQGTRAPSLHELRFPIWFPIAADLGADFRAHQKWTNKRVASKNTSHSWISCLP